MHNRRYLSRRVTLARIEAARDAIRGVALRTPLVPAPALALASGREVRLKLETTQPVGAFKIRGAAHALSRLSEAERRRGVICASTGNHGRAVAYAAARLGIRAIVCMSSLVPANKLAAIRALGAEVRIVGQSQDEAQVEVDRLVAEAGMVEIRPSIIRTWSRGRARSAWSCWRTGPRSTPSSCRCRAAG